MSDDQDLKAKILEMVPEYFKRSEPCYVDVRMRFDGDSDIDQDAEYFLDLINRNKGRCRRLLLTSRQWSVADTFTAAFGDKYFPALEQLAIHIEVEVDSVISNYAAQLSTIQPTMISGGAPVLRSVQLTGEAGPCQPPFNALTTLQLDGTHMDPMTYSQYLNLLDAIPKIQHLSLLHFVVVRDGDANFWRAVSAADIWPVSLPKQRSLRLCGSRRDGWQIRYHLFTLPIDQVESLVLLSVGLLKELLFPRIRTLSLKSCAFPRTGSQQTFPQPRGLDASGALSAVWFLSVFVPAHKEPDPYAHRLEELAVDSVAPQCAPMFPNRQFASASSPGSALSI